MKIYFYTLSNYDEDFFLKQCERFKNHPILKGMTMDRHGIVTDVDGSQIAVFYYKGQKIKLINDFEENECVVETPYNLEELLNIKFKNHKWVHEEDDYYWKVEKDS